MKRKILIVEDDPVHRAHLGRLIDRLGHEPVLLASGVEAVALIMNRPDPSFAAILLDLVMPDLDGMGVLTRLRAAGHHIPVIVLVKPTAMDSALTAIAAGAQDFSLVPASYERIAVSLTNLLSQTISSLNRASWPQPHRSVPLAPRMIAEASSARPMVDAVRTMPVSHSDSSVPIFDQKGRLRSLAAIEKDVIAFALRWKPNSLSSIARALGISRSTLYRRLEEIDPVIQEFEPPAYGDAA